MKEWCDMDIVRQIKEAKSDQEKIDLFMKYDQDIKTEDYFSFSTEELILAVKAGHYLCRFSKRLHTPEMCEIAVSLDGFNLKWMSKRCITKEICLKAVETSWMALNYVPKEYLDSDLLNHAVSYYGKALLWLSDKQKSLELCGIAVANDGLALKYVPAKHKKNADLLLSAVQSNGLALQYILKQRRTELLCAEAVKQNPFSLQYVPEEIKTESICRMALGGNDATLAFAPDDYYTVDTIIRAYRSCVEEKLGNDKTWSKDSNLEKCINLIFERVPDSCHNDPSLISLERQLGLRTIIRKYYSSSDNKFHVIESKKKLVFPDFDSFYNYLNGDLSGAELKNYNFDHVDPGAYSFKGAILKSADEARMTTPDFSLYSHVREEIVAGTFSQSKKNETIKAESVPHELSVQYNIENYRRLFYISDIHITHKIAKKAQKSSSTIKIKEYIETKVDQMVRSASFRNYNDYLMIAGDVSFDFRVSELFYRALAKRWTPRRIIVVLGNHELWDWTEENSSEDLESVIKKYRDLFSELQIVFLQNELFVESTKLGVSVQKKISYDQLLKFSPLELEDECSTCSLMVLGGVGFSGNNQLFNATHGIYKQTISTYEEDLRQTKLFEKIYKRIDKAFWNRTVIVLTHMPKSDWTKAEYNPNWIYVSGHTHNNDYYCGDDKTFYSDNQIGYSNTNISLKWFYTKKVLGDLDYYPDGIYQISHLEYKEYMHAKGIGMFFNRSDGQIIMLKRDGFFCFLYKAPSNDLFILNGGQIKALENNNVSYYYDEMALYGDFVKAKFSFYNSALKQISSEIQILGGSGKIHGSIVNIDFYNHISLNPVDGTISCYSAKSTKERFVPTNILSFLKAARPDMYKKYLALTSGADKQPGSSQNAMPELPNEPVLGYVIEDTTMYKVSRKLRSFQYILENDIIRVWDETVLEKMRAELESMSLSSPDGINESSLSD